MTINGGSSPVARCPSGSGVTGRRWAAILTDDEAAVLVKATRTLVADSGFTAREQHDLRRATLALNAARMVR
jgi:hypothetical protein